MELFYDTKEGISPHHIEIECLDRACNQSNQHNNDGNDLPHNDYFRSFFYFSLYYFLLVFYIHNSRALGVSVIITNHVHDDAR